MNEELIYEIVRKIRNYKQVKAVVLEIGQLSPFKQNELQDELRKYVRCDLKFITRQATIDCFCKYQGPPVNVSRGIDKVLYECPKCHRRGQKVVDGNKVILKKIELDNT